MEGPRGKLYALEKCLATKKIPPGLTLLPVDVAGLSELLLTHSGDGDV